MAKDPLTKRVLHSPELYPAIIDAVLPLLERADDNFSNAGCNDYELPYNGNNRLLVDAIERWNSDSMDEWSHSIWESEGKLVINIMDFEVLGYFMHLLRKLKEKAEQGKLHITIDE